MVDSISDSNVQSIAWYPIHAQFQSFGLVSAAFLMNKANGARDMSRSAAETTTHLNFYILEDMMSQDLMDNVKVHARFLFHSFKKGAQLANRFFAGSKYASLLVDNIIGNRKALVKTFVFLDLQKNEKLT